MSDQERWGAVEYIDAPGRLAGPYESEQEAIDRAPAELGLVGGDVFYVGRIVPYEPEPVDGRAVIDMAAELSWETTPEIEGVPHWLECVTEEDEAELTRRLTETWRQWLRDSGHWPEIQRLENQVELRVPDSVGFEASSEGDL